jgi:hypothetical protein
VISFSLSLSVFLRVLKAEREKERTRLIPFARVSELQRREATRRNYCDVKTIERKKKRLSLIFTHFFKISPSFLSAPDQKKHRKNTTL